MSKTKKPKARKAAPPTVLRFVSADGEPVDMPTAEAVVQQIEQVAQLKVLADAEFEWQRAQGSEADAEAARQRILAKAHEIRHRVVYQLQSIIDTAVHHLRTAQRAEQSSTETRTKAGGPTREAFAIALAAVEASGKKPTAPNLLNRWPTQSPPGPGRVQQLLREHRRDLEIQPPDKAH